MHLPTGALSATTGLSAGSKALGSTQEHELGENVSKHCHLDVEGVESTWLIVYWFSEGEGMSVGACTWV